MTDYASIRQELETSPFFKDGVTTYMQLLAPAVTSEWNEEAQNAFRAALLEHVVLQRVSQCTLSGRDITLRTDAVYLHLAPFDYTLMASALHANVEYDRGLIGENKTIVVKHDSIAVE